MRARAALAAMVLPVAVGACGIINDDAYIDLGRGYGFQRMNGCELALEHAADIVITGNPAAYARRGTLVAGYTDLAGYSWDTIEEQSLQSGFFLIDTASGSTRANLAETDWRRMLHDRGWSHIRLTDIPRSCNHASET